MSVVETQTPQPPRRNRSRRRRNRGKRLEEDEEEGSPTWQKGGEFYFKEETGYSVLVQAVIISFQSTSSQLECFWYLFNKFHCF